MVKNKFDRCSVCRTAHSPWGELRLQSVKSIQYIITVILLYCTVYCTISHICRYTLKLSKPSTYSQSTCRILVEYTCDQSVCDQ